MRLKVDILRIENIVITKVLEQDEDLRNVPNHVIISENGYGIKSNITPSISENELWIRGSDSKRDDVVAGYAFSLVGEAMNWCENIKKLIDKINDEETSENSLKVERY